MASSSTQGGGGGGSGGIFFPLPAVITLALAFATLIAAYVFATKAELMMHAGDEGHRITVLEQTTKRQAEDIKELKDTVKAVDQNVRTLMTEQGVPATKISVPKEQ